MTTYARADSVLNALLERRVVVATARGNFIGTLTYVAYDADDHPSLLHLEMQAATMADADTRPVDIAWHAVISIARAIDPPATTPPTETTAVHLTPAATRIAAALEYLDVVDEMIHADILDGPELPAPWVAIIEANIATIRDTLGGAT